MLLDPRLKKQLRDIRGKFLELEHVSENYDKANILKPKVGPEVMSLISELRTILSRANEDLNRFETTVHSRHGGIPEGEHYFFKMNLVFDVDNFIYFGIEPWDRGQRVNLRFNSRKFVYERGVREDYIDKFRENFVGFLQQLYSTIERKQGAIILLNITVSQGGSVGERAKWRIKNLLKTTCSTLSFAKFHSQKQQYIDGGWFHDNVIVIKK